MKKKSIFVVALAALMLIAFTACEQPVPGLSKSIIDATIVQNGTFLVGQPYDASKFSVNVTYSDKSTGTLEGVNVVYVGGEKGSTAASVANGDKVQVSLPVSAPNYSGTSNVQKDVTFTGSIVAYTIDSITVSGPATVNSTDGSAKAPKASDLSAVASYRDSSGAVKTVNLIAADLSLVTTGDGAPAFVDKDTTEVTKDEPTALASVKVYVKWQSAAAANFQYTVQYVESTEPAPTYTYVWADTAETDGFRQIAYEILPETAANRYIQRGEFNADDFVAVYKVMVPTDEDGVVVTEENFKKAYEEAGYAEKDIPEYYQLEKLTAGKGETLSVTLTNPLEVTVDEKTTTYADRFDEAEDAAISLVYEYVGNEATGELVVLSNTENNTVIGQVTREDSGKAIVDVDAGVDGLTITGLIADYATDVNIKIADGEAGSAQATPVEAGTSAEDLELTITAKTWKSEFRASDLADADNVVTPITITGTVPSVSGDAAKSTSVSVVLQMTDTIYSDSRYSKNITGVWVQNEIV